MAQDGYVIYHNKTNLTANVASTVLTMLIVLPCFVQAVRQHQMLGFGVWTIVITMLIVLEIFCVCALIKMFRLLISPQPALIINQEGVLDNVHLMGAGGWMPWDDIAHFGVRGRGMRRSLWIAPRSQAALFKRKPLFTRLFMLMSLFHSGGRPVQITTGFLLVTADTMCDEMRRHRPDLCIQSPADDKAAEKIGA